jgi:protein-L-isoaspartate(D-aspartate) O-methyltransferase
MLGRDSRDDLFKARKRMLERDLERRGITDVDVLKVMADIPREEFVPETYRSRSYADGPLPIGMGQTISQPYIVALMTEELRLNPTCEVLEIGTGSGYQTAILSRLAKKVYTIEKFAQLSELAQAALNRLAVNNVEFHVGDGSAGWPASRLPLRGCFDRIIITASVPEMPRPLVEQLAENGLIVGPVGCGAVQELIAGEKKKGKLIETPICSCRFVKLIGKYGCEQ